MYTVDKVYTFMNLTTVKYKESKKESVGEMIVNERMVTYIHSLEEPENPILEKIEQEAFKRMEGSPP